MASRYTYQSLEGLEQHIRLLIIHPAKSNDAPLECSLEAYPLQEAELKEYETVSYVWGSPHTTSDTVIHIQGKSLEVTASVDKLLRRLRRGGRDRTLWVDFVCIDQSNLEERGSQVGLMSDIYRNGKHNLVFLGDGSGKAALTIATIRELNQLDASIQSFAAYTDKIQALDELLSNDWFQYVIPMSLNTSNGR